VELGTPHHLWVVLLGTRCWSSMLSSVIGHHWFSIIVVRCLSLSVTVHHSSVLSSSGVVSFRMVMWEIFTFPRLFHMESMESIRYSMWNDHGMVMEWLIPYGIQLYSTWIPWNKSIWIPLKFHMENTTIFVVKNSVKYEN